MKQSFSCFAVILIWSISPCWSQDDTLDKNALVEKGEMRFAEGHYYIAKQAFEAALDLDRDLVRAHAGLGRIALVEKDWGDVKDRFEDALKRDPNHFEAHYYSAIGYRETGKLKALFLRRRDFGRANKHFQWIAERDSTYKDVLYQWARLKRHQEKFGEAIALGHAQLEVKPGAPGALVGLYGLYRNFLRNKGDKEVMAWLEVQTWPQARFFIGEVHRRRGDFEEAKAVYYNMFKRRLDVDKQVAYQALCRIHFSEDDLEAGERYYWQAVEEIETLPEAELVLDDAKYVLTDEELQAFKEIKSASGYHTFFRSIWAKRNPTPASQYNVRLAEHYRRLSFAEKHYEYDGLRTWFNNPDKFRQLSFPEVYYLNDEYNDKGLIYIRHGEADDRVATLGADIGTNESWHYYRTNASRELTFHFVVDGNASPSNWRLTPIISNVEMLADRVQWGHVYHRMLNERPADRMGSELEMLNESMASVETGFSTDRHSFEEEVEHLDAPFYSASFRGSRGATRLEVFYGFPVEPVVRQLDKATQNMLMERGFAIHGQDWQPLKSSLDTLKLPFDRSTLKDKDLVIDIFRATMPADSYNVAFHLNPSGTKLLGGNNFNLRLPRYSRTELQMSDLLTAFSISPTRSRGKFTRNGLMVVPNPSRAFPKDKPLSAYFEVYNLEKDENGSTSFSVEYTLTLKKRQGGRGIKKLFRIFGGQKQTSVSLRNQRGGDSEFSPEFITFDVSNMEKGAFELSVKIVDNHSQRVVDKQMELFLY